MEKKYEGKMVWFDNARGYGFCTIDGDENKVEYFVHFSVIDVEGYKTLKAKQPITFLLKDTDKGIQAYDVKPI